MGRARGLVGLSALGLLQALSFYVISPILPQYVEGFGVSYAEISYFFSAYSMIDIHVYVYYMLEGKTASVNYLNCLNQSPG